jgi:hypothetical protein
LLKGGDFLNGTITKSILTYLAVLAMAFGFVVCLKGFGDAVYAGWATSFLATGLSELLFGISLIAIGNGLATLAKR